MKTVALRSSGIIFEDAVKKELLPRLGITYKQFCDIYEKT
jgi:hypothetical protein